MSDLSPQPRRPYTDPAVLRFDVLALHRSRVLPGPAGTRWTTTWELGGLTLARVEGELVFLPGWDRIGALKIGTEQGSYRVSLDWTPCFEESWRPWLCCPRCGSRRRYLYLRPQGHPLRCWTCAGLIYRSRQGSGTRFYEGLERPLRALDALEAARSTGGRPSKRRRRAWRRLERADARASRYLAALGLGP